MNSKPRSVLGMVFLVVFIDLVGFSIIFPLFPQMLEHYLELEGPDSLIGKLDRWLRDFAGSDINADFAVATLFGGMLGSIYSGLQFLFAPVWGGLSDRKGRRWVLLVTLSGTALSYLVWMFSGTFAVLIAARLLGGIMAGNISTASAVVGDTTEGKDRAKGMGILGMGIGLGFIFGPAIGGLSAMLNVSGDATNPGMFALNPFSVPAMVAFVLALVNLVWVVRSFPETLPPERRGTSQHRPGLHPFAAVKRLDIPALARTSWTYFSYLLAFSAMEFTLTFLARERFDFGPGQNAWMFVFVGLIIALVQGGFVRRLAPRMGEKKLALFGLAITAPGFLLVGLCQSVLTLYLGLFFMAVGSGFVMPTLSALVSRYTPSDRQGLALGSFRSAGALSRAVGPILGGFLYYRFSSEVPYFVAAAFVAIPLVLAVALPPVPVSGPDSDPGAEPTAS